jgi:hypothetical protein
MFQIANSYYNAEEANQHHKDDVAQNSQSKCQSHRNDDRRKEQRDDNRDRRYHDRLEGSRAEQYHHHRSKNVIASVAQPRPKCNYDANYEKLLDGPCLIHKGSKHTMRQCYGLTRAYRAEDNKRMKRWDDHEDDPSKDPEHPRDTNNSFQDPSKTVSTIFGGVAASENKRKQKLLAR